MTGYDPAIKPYAYDPERAKRLLAEAGHPSGFSATLDVPVGYQGAMKLTILVESSLSFLGLGVQPPSPDWGLQVFEHYGLISGGFWWPVLFPAAAIAILVIGVNLIADGLTQAFER